MHILEYEGNPVCCFSIDEEDERVTIQRVYVDENFQGSGIGSWIIDQGVALGHSARNPFTAEVLSNNHPSILFYKNSGFETVERETYKIAEDSELYLDQDIIIHKDTIRYSPRFWIEEVKELEEIGWIFVLDVRLLTFVPHQSGFISIPISVFGCFPFIVKFFTFCQRNFKLCQTGVIKVKAQWNNGVAVTGNCSV